MRRTPSILSSAALAVMAFSPAALAQTATATSPSQSSSGGSAAMGPSGGTASPQRSQMAGQGKPVIGGTTADDIRLEKKLDHDMTICKGC